MFSVINFYIYKIILDSKFFSKNRNILPNYS